MHNKGTSVMLSEGAQEKGRRGEEQRAKRSKNIDTLNHLNNELQLLYQLKIGITIFLTLNLVHYFVSEIIYLEVW